MTDPRPTSRRPTRSPTGTSASTATPTSSACSTAVGYALDGRPAGGRRAGRHPREARARAAGRRVRGGGSRGTAGAGRAQPGAHLDDRPGLLRHDHAAGDPPQRAREPGLVHRVHALPAGDQPGPARGAAQLPDDGRGPHRPAGRRRVHARRGDRGRRGDGTGAPRRSKTGDTFVIDADAFPQTIDVVRTRAEPLGLKVVVQDLVRAAPGRGRVRRARAVPRRVRCGT